MLKAEGRLDASKKANAVHPEPVTTITGETGQAIAAAIEELAKFLGTPFKRI